MANNMIPACPVCGMENTYPDGDNFICPDCSHEWSATATQEESEEKRVHKDAHGNVLNDGDTVTLIKDLKVKEIPKLTEEEQKEFISILSYSAPRIMEYFNIAKSVWTIVFDSLDMKIRRNKKNVVNPKGYFYFIDNSKKHYVWEYTIKKQTKSNPQQMTNVNLVYSDQVNDLTISKIINNFSTFTVEERRSAPIFQMTCSGEFPIEETLLPMFKRRISGFISQSKTL